MSKKTFLIQGMSDYSERNNNILELDYPFETIESFDYDQLINSFQFKAINIDECLFYYPGNKIFEFREYSSEYPTRYYSEVKYIPEDKHIHIEELLRNWDMNCCETSKKLLAKKYKLRIL